MKKIITLCLFVFTMFIGNQSVVAQNTVPKNKIEINGIAAEKTEALRKFIKFSDEQRDRVYQAQREYTIASLNVNPQDASQKEQVKKIEDRLETKMKNILTEEQFSKYKEFPQD